MQSSYSGRRTRDDSRYKGSHNSGQRRSVGPPPPLGGIPGPSRRGGYSPSFAPRSPVNSTHSRSLSPHGRSTWTSPVQPYRVPEPPPSEEDRANMRWRAWRPEENPLPTLSLRSPTFRPPPPASQAKNPLITATNSRSTSSTSSSSSVAETPSPVHRRPEPDPANIWDDNLDEDVDGGVTGDFGNVRSTTTEPWLTSETPAPKKRSNDKVEFYLVNSNARMISVEDIGARREHKQSPSKPALPNMSASLPKKSVPPPPKHTEAPPPAFPVNDSPFMYPNFLGKPSPDHYQQYQDVDVSGPQWQTPAPRNGNGGGSGNSSNGDKKPYLHPDDVLYSQRRPYFNQFMSPEEMERGIAEGTLYRGVLRINRRNRYDAYVSTEHLDGDVYIGGEKDRNRAFDGDVVAVRLLDIDEVWKKRKERSQRSFGRRDASVESIGNEEDDELDYDPSDEEDQNYKPKYAGEVVGILDKPAERLCAGFIIIEKSGDEKGVDVVDPNNGTEAPRVQRMWFKPLDKRMPLMFILSRDAPPDILEREEYYKKRLLVAKKTKWPISMLRPCGKILRVLGEVGDLKSESQAILANCGISEEPFSTAALHAVPSLPWHIPRQEFNTRRDMRFTRAFSIDPETARDLDDVLHIRRLNDGEFFEVGVHIADVSYFVKPNSPLDTEARERGSSAYLVDRVVPMLPKELSEELCSLKPGAPKLAFSVIWKMDRDANIMNTWLGKTVIQSCAQLSYAEAQSVIEGHGLPSSAEVIGQDVSEVESDILDLMFLARKLRARRYDNGALALQSVKLTFELDSQGEPTSVSSYQAKDANRLVEEFMLRANISAAQKISGKYPQEALLRRHKGPVIRKLYQFLEHAEELGFKLKAETAGELQASFGKLEDGGVKDVLLALAIKPMRRADYFCAGAIDTDMHKHYALNEPVYTHFTSPIRRYADIVVHRQLEAALKNKSGCGFSKRLVQKIAFQCNFMKERARSAQDMSIHLYLARYLSEMEKNQGPVVRKGIVMAVHPQAVDIYVSEFGLERRIFLEHLPLEGYGFEDNHRTVVLQWKPGVLVNVQSQLERLQRSSKNRSNLSRQQQQTDINDEDNDGSESSEDEVPGKTIPQIPAQTLTVSPLDQAKCTQKLKVFATLDVRLQVNSQRSPPFINVYPMNPFP